MPSPLQYAGQFTFYALLAAFTGYFASHPVYRQVPEGMAQIKLSFAHGGSRKTECRRLTSEEIAALPPSERRPNTCSRERIAMRVQLAVDGAVLYEEDLQPTGLWNDGPARTYRKFLVPAGPHRLDVRLRDSRRDTGFDYEATRQVTLSPWQNLAVDFHADIGGFIFR